MGLAVIVPLSRSLRIRPFGEAGVNDYPEVEGEACSEDIRAVGAGLEWTIDAKVRLYLLATYLWQAAVESLKWLLGHKRTLRRQRVAVYWQVLRSGLK